GAIEGLGHVFHTYWSPFYPLVVALFSKVTPDFEWVGRMVSIITGVLVIIPIYLFSHKYFGRKVAKYTASLLAFYPSLAFFNTRAQTESLYILLITIAVLIGWKVLQNQSKPLAFLIGILFGCAYLTKPEGIGFLVVFGAVLFVYIIYYLLKKRNTLPWILVGLVMAGGFIAVSIPYLIYLKQKTGVWTISAKGKANQQFEAHSTGLTGIKGDPFRTLSEDNTEVAIDQIYHIGSFIKAEQKRGEPTVPVSPGVVLRKYLENLYKVIAFSINNAITSVLLMLTVFGIFGNVWSGDRAKRDLYLLSFFIFFWLVVIPLFHINSRYFLPLLPLCFIWIGKGFDELIQWLQKTMPQAFLSEKYRQISPRLAVFMAVFLIFFGLYLPQIGKIVIRSPDSTEYWADPVEQKSAGEWIKKNSDKKPIIMSRGHTVDFYAGNYNIAESVTIPRNELSRVLAYAKHRGVNFIVLNERYRSGYPEIAHLLNGMNVPDELKLVYQEEKEPGLKVVVYQINSVGVKNDDDFK
ncbi:MAG: glycosyltransferase family 39 protein, partial [bacterium]|nr:glycosyltransferase family 39 protein [bacterium]